MLIENGRLQRAIRLPSRVQVPLLKFNLVALAPKQNGATAEHHRHAKVVELNFQERQMPMLN